MMHEANAALDLRPMSSSTYSHVSANLGGTAQSAAKLAALEAELESFFQGKGTGHERAS